MFIKLSLIFVAAGLGGVLRFLLAHGVQSMSSPSSAWLFPVGTLVVNIVGCLLIGFLATAFLGDGTFGRVPEYYQIALVVGLLGGFTTFSAFSYETLRLFSDQEYKLAMLYILMSNVGGLGAALVGWVTAAKIFAD